MIVSNNVETVPSFYKIGNICTLIGGFNIINDGTSGSIEILASGYPKPKINGMFGVVVNSSSHLAYRFEVNINGELRSLFNPIPAGNYAASMSYATI